MAKKWLTILGLAAAISASTFAADSNTWKIDPDNSAAQFMIRHFVISNIRGDFTKMAGTVVLNDKDISKSSVNATVDVASVDTRVPMRDDHLRSADFFDVAKYPTMTFQSTRIWKTAAGATKMTGNLTLHGITKEVTFDVIGPTAAIKGLHTIRRGAEATAKISRKDFGMAFDLDSVSDLVIITLDIEMTQPDPDAPPPAAAGQAPPAAAGR